MRTYNITIEFEETGETYFGHSLLRHESQNDTLWAFRPFEELNRFVVFGSKNAMKKCIREVEA